MHARFSSSLRAVFAVAFCLGFVARSFAQGSLEPPAGPPAPTMKTLDQVEPRKPIHAKDLPLTINQPGSYYLAESIAFDRQDTNGITISSPDVTIDLKGFALNGPGVQAGKTGTGIIVDPAKDGLRRINILNGSISGWSGSGINLNSGSPAPGKNTGQCFESFINHVSASSNGVYGIEVYEDTVISECTAMANGSAGMYGVYFTIFKDSIASHNGGDGMAGSQGCRFMNNICANNMAGRGINAGARCFVQNNNVESNNIGISGGSGSVVIGNNAVSNSSNYSVSSQAVLGPIVTAATQLTANAPNANYSF